ncbi:unnamed protein product, partial [Protopolystoma xenopodis]
LNRIDRPTCHIQSKASNYIGLTPSETINRCFAKPSRRRSGRSLSKAKGSSCETDKTDSCRMTFKESLQTVSSGGREDDLALLEAIGSVEKIRPSLAVARKAGYKITHPCKKTSSE